MRFGCALVRRGGCFPHPGRRRGDGRGDVRGDGRWRPLEHRGCPVPDFFGAIRLLARVARWPRGGLLGSEQSPGRGGMARRRRAVFFVRCGSLMDRRSGRLAWLGVGRCFRGGGTRSGRLA